MKKLATTNQVLIKCYYPNEDYSEIITLEKAIDRLSGYWQNPKELILSGNILFTPFAQYELKK